MISIFVTLTALRLLAFHDRLRYRGTEHNGLGKLFAIKGIVFIAFVRHIQIHDSQLYRRRQTLCPIHLQGYILRRFFDTYLGRNGALFLIQLLRSRQTVLHFEQ